MAYTRTYYPQFNFLLTQCSGIIDDQALLIHLMSLSNELKAFSHIRELVDVRSLRNAKKITASGLIQNANVFRNLLSHVEFTSAVLIKAPEDKKPVEIYLQLFASAKMKSKVFEKDVVEAIHWLGYGEDDAEKIKRFMEKHTKPA